MITIQLIGVIVGLAAIHITYIYYKRTNFTKREVFFWVSVWLAFIFVALFPNSVRPVVGYLGFQRPMDLIMVVAFIILFALTFHNYVVNRRMQDKLEKLIRELALNDLESK